MGTFRIRTDKQGRKRYQYMIDIRRKGRKFYKSQTFKSKREALNWEKEFLYKVEAGIITKETLKKRTVSDGIEKFIATILSKRQTNQDNVLQHLKWFEEKIGRYQISDVTPAVASDLRDQLLEEVGPKGKIRQPATALRYLASMSAVFQACIKDWMWISLNPFRAIRRPSPGKRKMRTFSIEEIKKIHDACSPYMQRIFTIALHTGMRRGEVLNLLWENIDFKNKILHLPMTKNGEPRDVPMTNEVHKILLNLLGSEKRAQIAGLVFPSPKNPLKPIDIKSNWERILKQAGITDATFHTIRHTTASHLASLGIHPTLISRILGHKDSRTTDIYIDLIKKHGKEVMDKLEAQFAMEPNA